MKKWFTLVLILGALTTLANEKPWNPAQYYLEWDVIANARYRVFLSAQPTNEGYYTKDTNGAYTVFVPNTNYEFSPWYQARYRPNEEFPTNEWSFDVADNRLDALQGKSEAAVKYFVVAVVNNVMYKTSNITGWPTNWNTVSSNGFELRLVRVPLGPPMYYKQIPPPSNLRVL